MAQEAGPLGVLSEALEVFQNRGSTYDEGGGVEGNFAAVATIASILLGKPMTAREVALVMAAFKMQRIGTAPAHRDSYVDLVNYVAFAAALTPQGKLPKAVEGGKVIPEDDGGLTSIFLGLMIPSMLATIIHPWVGFTLIGLSLAAMVLWVALLFAVAYIRDGIDNLVRRRRWARQR